MNDDAPSGNGVRLEPEPSGWRALLLDRWKSSQGDRDAMTAREALGLPTDRPIVMTGHQPIFFHPGVLAKYFAAGALAKASGASAAWLVVDHDETDPGAIDVPTRDAAGTLQRETLRLLNAPADGVPAGSVGPSGVTGAETRSEWPFVAEGLGRIASSLGAHVNSATLADQSSSAAFDLLSDFGLEGSVLRSTHLARTAPFASLVQRMAEDPLGFVERYNAAVAEHASAGVAPIRHSLVGDYYELPLWRLAPDAPRARVYAHDLDAVPTETLAPRALLMTLVARWAVCDLFIHGTGGWEYDRVVESMAASWLGEPIAPMTLTTATRTLPLLDAPTPTAAEVADAKALAHRAAHDPDLLGDEAAAERKRRMLTAITDLPRRSAERAAEFRRMHDLLEAVRERRAHRLTEFRDRATSLARAHASATIANDRAWAFPLYPREMLRDMQREVGRAIDG
ncbi:MAG: hypothetical protein ACTS27_00825 [Phycisphaerales bacterium]